MKKNQFQKKKMAGKMKALNVKIGKILDKLEDQTNLQEIVKYLKEIIVKFEDKLIVKDVKDKEDMICKEDIDADTHSITDICRESNDEESIVEHTNDKDNISRKEDTLEEPKSLAIQEIKRKSISKLVICEHCQQVFD